MAGLANIKARLVTNFTAIGNSLTVESQTPKTAPQTDFPHFILERQDPFLTVTAESNQECRYYWHFNGVFLLNPIGVDTIDYWDTNIAAWPKRFVDALMGDLKLNGNVQDIGGGASGSEQIRFEVGIVEYLGARYFGFTMPFTVVEIVVTTFA